GAARADHFVDGLQGRLVGGGLVVRPCPRRQRVADARRSRTLVDSVVVSHTSPPHGGMPAAITCHDSLAVRVTVAQACLQTQVLNHFGARLDNVSVMSTLNLSLPSAAAEDGWKQLVSWARWLRDTEATVGSVLADCWPRHPDVVLDLLALWDW